MNIKSSLAALGMVMLLAACGDSPQADAPAAVPQANSVPATALATTTAFSQFAASLTKTETGTPIEVNGVVPPTSETAEPIPVL